MKTFEYNTIERQAVRIIFILNFCHDKPSNNIQLAMFDQNSPRYIDSETKLQKIDFWVRNPDHLSAALLYLCEENILSRPDCMDVKQVIRKIFQNEEPELRRIPMHKYLRGAYEPLDEVMVFLHSRYLANREKRNKGYQTRYILTVKGIQVVDTLMRQCPESHWYADRCKLISKYFGNLKGFDLRKIQYLEAVYDDALFSEKIAGIEHQVRKRFKALYGESL